MSHETKTSTRLYGDAGASNDFHSMRRTLRRAHGRIYLLPYPDSLHAENASLHQTFPILFTHLITHTKTQSMPAGHQTTQVCDSPLMRRQYSTLPLPLLFQQPPPSPVTVSSNGTSRAKPIPVHSRQALAGVNSPLRRPSTSCC